VVEIDTQDDRYTVSSQIGSARTKYRFGGNLASGNITITFVLKWGTIGATVTEAMKAAVKSALQTQVTAAWSGKANLRVTDPVCGEKTLPINFRILWNPGDTTDAEHFTVDLEKEPRRSSVAFPKFTLDHDADLNDEAWTLKHEFGHGFGGQDEYFYSGVTSATIQYKRADGTSETITLEPAASLMQTRGNTTVEKRFLYFVEIEAQKLLREKSGRNVVCKVE
jgi:type VI secretion system secreted protein VgrG